MVIVIVYYDSTKISDCIHVVVDQSSIFTRAVEGVGAAIEEEALEDFDRNADLYYMFLIKMICRTKLLF